MQIFLKQVKDNTKYSHDMVNLFWEALDRQCCETATPSHLKCQAIFKRNFLKVSTY